MSEKSDKYKTGEATRRSVLGDAHVDRSKSNLTEFDAPFQELITETAWGSVWSRPHLTKRERSLLTVAILAALGRDGELKLHAKACRNTGATMEDLREAMLHVAVYAGVPAANHAIGLIKQVMAEADGEADG